MKRDLTVHAAVGDRKTILGLAREHSVPIDCECEKAESEALEPEDIPPKYRLSCHYMPLDVDIGVKL